MSKSKFRGRRRRPTGRPGAPSETPGTHEERQQPEYEGPEPTWFRPIFTYILGFAYFGVSAILLIMADMGVEQVGAVCEEQCGGAKFLGVSLEWWGSSLMAAILGARWLTTQTPNINARFLLAALALGHAGASLAFASSMMFGFADYCLLCVVAAAISLGVAVSCWPTIRSAFEVPLIPVAQGVALGFIGVVAIWPFLDGLGPENGAEEYAEETMLRGEEPTPRETVASAEPAEEAEPPAEPPRQVDPAERASRLREAVDAMTIGDPDAPYELVMITDFTCNICQEFERRHLPTIVAEGVENGDIRVRFLLTRRGADRRRAFFELVASSSLAMAGMPVEEAITLMRENRVVTSQNGIALAEDDELRQRALEIMHEVSDTAEWINVVEEHEQIIMRLRQQYFPGRTGTPAFVMVRGGLDVNNLPREGAGALALYGFRNADPFLEFAGLR